MYLWVGLVVAGLGVVQGLADGSTGKAPLVLVAALACGGGVALLPRALVWATVGVAASVVAMVLLIEVPLFATFLATMITACTLARYAEAGQALVGFTIVLLSVVVVAVPEVRASDAGVFGVVYPVVYFGGAGLLGWLTRQRAKYVSSLQDVAESLEREQLQRVELAAASERERIAREMHDVISHGVSLMVVQAEAASEVLAAQPDAAARALEAIADTGRSAMMDLHRMIGVLQGQAPDLHELAAHVGATGLAVHLEVDPGWSLLDEPVRLALYRVAQEAITNTLRHAEGAGAVSLRCVRVEGEMVVEVIDDGRGGEAGSAGLGSGLSGLRDRLVELGGSLDAGPTAGGGFLVRGSLPVVAA